MEKTAFAAALSDAFEGGERQQRELRLSPAERDYLCRCCPGAQLTPLSPSGDKTWYRVCLCPEG